ncbi:MAG: hypothetical protein AAGF94_10995 [Pseudomonadota bacterium]
MTAPRPDISKKLAYADPPYPGCAKLYEDHPDYAGEVDHRELVERLEAEYDGWVLHTHVAGLRMLERERILPEGGIRICQWIKPFAAFKRNVPVAYAYEPVIIKAARKPVVSKRLTMRDWYENPVVRESIAMKKGLTGAKVEGVCHWAFEVMAARPEDTLDDLYPGTGAVSAAWRSWQGKFNLPGEVA